MSIPHNFCRTIGRFSLRDLFHRGRSLSDNLQAPGICHHRDTCLMRQCRTSNNPPNSRSFRRDQHTRSISYRQGERCPRMFHPDINPHSGIECPLKRGWKLHRIWRIRWRRDTPNREGHTDCISYWPGHSNPRTFPQRTDPIKRTCYSVNKYRNRRCTRGSNWLCRGRSCTARSIPCRSYP